MKTVVSSIPEVQFNNPRLARVGVEAMTLQELRQRTSAGMLSAPQRVDFHHLLFILEGRSRHMVDFVEHPLQPGSILLVRSGQVQQWHLSDELQGQLTLISAQALVSAMGTPAIDTGLLALDQWPSVSTPRQGLFMEAMADNSRLRADIDRFDESLIDAAIIRHEVLTMLLRLARVLRSEGGTLEMAQEGKIYRLFCQELEASFKTRPSVLDLARKIGFSESTLSRACVATAGRTAKEVIDQRIALEAKRLLAHSTATTAEIGHVLGFSEATNFVKFFRRMAQTTPVAFRTEHRFL
jgi:AraC-like DNA-binding protein